jgi:hypothetical protein
LKKCHWTATHLLLPNIFMCIAWKTKTLNLINIKIIQDTGMHRKYSLVVLNIRESLILLKSINNKFWKLVLDINCYNLLGTAVVSIKACAHTHWPHDSTPRWYQQKCVPKVKTKMLIEAQFILVQNQINSSIFPGILYINENKLT